MSEHGFPSGAKFNISIYLVRGRTILTLIEIIPSRYDQRAKDMLHRQHRATSFAFIMYIWMATKPLIGRFLRPKRWAPPHLVHSSIQAVSDRSWMSLFVWSITLCDSCHLASVHLTDCLALGAGLLARGADQAGALRLPFREAD